MTYTYGGFSSSTDLASGSFTGTLRGAIRAARKYVREALGTGATVRVRDDSGEIVYSATI